MKRREQSGLLNKNKSSGVAISRRAAIASSGAIALCAMSGGALGQEGGFSGLPKEIQERMAKSREFSERMRNAGSDEERTRIMEERAARERTRAIEDVRGQLEIAEAEWSVLKPRVEAVYRLVHPQPQFGGTGNMGSMSPVDRSKNELRQMLASKDASADQIKAKLTALRVAQEQSRQELTKARQQLRQILTIRQEAVLVLSELLD